MKIYLEQHNLKITTGGKGALIARVLQHARGVETQRNEEISSNAGDTNFQCSDSESYSVSQSGHSEMDGFVESCCEVIFVPDADVQQLGKQAVAAPLAMMRF